MKHIFNQLNESNISVKNTTEKANNCLVYILFLFLTALSTHATGQFVGGDGSVSNPWQIATAAQLDSVRNYLDSSFILINDIDMDIAPYNADSGWTPIGFSEARFTGSFNGSGHSISNLYINRNSSDQIGLFGYTQSASIDSLAILNCNITGQNYVGSLVGYNHTSNIMNCYATGEVNGNSSVGGLFGYIRNSSIEYCFTTTNVTGISNNIGGLIGQVYDHANISYCYTTGAVKGSSSIGGLTGYLRLFSYIENCYATGSVSGISNIGGISGHNRYSYIRYSYATNKVSGENSIGGIAGLNTASNFTNIYCNVEISPFGTGTKLTTAEMKQESSFSGFDFVNTWTITNGKTFPRLRSVHNAPILLHSKMVFKMSMANFDTLHVIPMDNEEITFTLESAPDGLLLQDSIITWTPDSTGDFTYTVKAEDAYLASSTSTNAIGVVTLNGKGTNEAPFQIATIEELAQVKYALNSYYVLKNDLNFNGSAYDSVNSTEGWEPIGSVNNPFRGNFKGAGYSINNLYINRESTTNIGLFGYAVGAVIDSLSVLNCNISGLNNVGGLTGHNSSSSSINNCYVNGEVKGDTYVGGLVGRNEISSIIGNCYAIVNVSGTDGIGGLVGLNFTSAKIEQCYASGIVSGTSDKVGGLVGYNYKSSGISNCYATGSVTGDSYTGGLVGYNYTSSTINNCYSTGKVSGNSYTNCLVGRNYSSSIVTNSYYNYKSSGQGAGEGNRLNTDEMKQDTNFTGFNFDTVWAITNGKTFPRLQAVHNAPIILHTSVGFKIGIENTDTLRVVPMDNYNISLTLESAPDGMLLQDSLITWTPDSIGVFSYSVKAEDANLASSKSTNTIGVVNLNGMGNENNPYQITTIEELLQVRFAPCNYYKLMNDLDFIGTPYCKDSSATGWEPLGNQFVPFSGNLDGGGHSISNLYINRTSTNYVGLFGCMKRGAIDSLAVLNCDIAGRYYVGSIVGYNFSSAVMRDCFATGEVTGENNIGGLVGRNILSSIIANSYFTGKVTGTTYVGGLTGINHTSSTIENCYATGEVFADGDHIGGLVGYNYKSSVIKNCYATANVSGIENVGGLTGYNRDASVIENCYSTGIVTGTSSYTGGLLGRNNSASVSNAYYNTTSSGFSMGEGTELVTNEMKQDSSFKGFNFDTVWAIRNDTTYPVLQAMDNAPFAFADTVQGITVFYSCESFLQNDYDFETLQGSLVIKVEGISSGNIWDNTVQLPDTTEVGDTFTVYYKVGEITSYDTLWGNIASSVLIAGANTTPVLTKVKETTLLRDASVTFSMDDVTATDADGDLIFLVIYEGDNYSVSGTTVTPNADFYGTLSIPVSVTDGRDTSDILSIGIIVNDKPVITAVNELFIPIDSSVTLSMDDITAIDRDGDVLTLIVYEQDNYSVSGTTVTPDAGFSGAIMVQLAVTDGIDTSNFNYMSITVEEILGINHTLSGNIHMYPNPANNILTIDGIKGNEIIEIIQINGRVVFKGNISTNKTIDISSLPEGMYFVLLKAHGIRYKVLVN